VRRARARTAVYNPSSFDQGAATSNVFSERAQAKQPRLLLAHAVAMFQPGAAGPSPYAVAPARKQKRGRCARNPTRTASSVP
jgi:hypothetical protein